MNNTEDLIPWGPALVTGITRIDEQHRVLVDMCNEAHVLLQQHATTERTKGIVRDLMSYALYHFETEEELADSCGYNDAHAEENAKHREQHRAFANAVAGMQLDMSRGIAVSIEALFDFLRSWLTNHILGMDMELGKFINSKNGAAGNPSSA